MDAKTLASSVCRDIVKDVSKRGFRSFVITQFQYPDGDYICVYPDKKKNQISDLGNTTYKLRLDHVDTNTDRRRQMIESVCNLYGVKIHDHQIVKDFSDDTVALDFLSLCEAVLRISNLLFDTAPKQQTQLYTQTDQLLNEHVAPNRKIERGWTADFDTNKSHPVDFRMNSAGTARHLFHISSLPRSDQVVAIVYFLQLHRMHVPTLSIVDPRLKLGKDREDRLEVASDICIGLAGNEEIIVDFALATTNQ